MIIKNARIFNGEKFIKEDAVIINNDKIIDICNSAEISQDILNSNEVVDINGQVLSPGFIDLQINGCGGVLFNDDISFEALEIMNETNKKYGCTSFLPTLITSPDGKILKALELIENIKDKRKYRSFRLTYRRTLYKCRKKRCS